MSQAVQTDFAPLGRCRTVALTTFRHDGQPVVTRVAFALDGNRLYVALPANTEVIRRIHENAQVEVAPCGGDDGSPIEAMAVVVPDEKSGDARRALAAFGLRQMFRDFLLTLARTHRVYLEITPM